MAKGGREAKSQLIDTIREAAGNFPRLLLVQVWNMRNASLKELRMRWKPDSRFFFGKHAVMRVALGRTAEEEIAEGISKVANAIRTGTGLLFTEKSLKEVQDHFDTMQEAHYARAGTEVYDTITIEAGPLTQFGHSLEPRLRQLGLPTRLNKGVIELLETVDLCAAGDVLSSEQAALLRLFDHKLALFRMQVVGAWEAESGKFVDISPSPPQVTRSISGQADMAEE